MSELTLLPHTATYVTYILYFLYKYENKILFNKLNKFYLSKSALVLYDVLKV